MLNPLHVQSGAEPAGRVVVLLAGAYDQPADFLTHGFGAALRDSGLALDLLLVESHLPAVCDGSLAARLQADCLAPLRAAGRRVLLGGISIGGLTVLQHAARFAGEQIAAHLLLAPYPGNRAITAEIARGGGLEAWADAVAGQTYPDNDERCGWRALAALARAGRPPWLGYGADDRFAPGHRLMAGVLPPDRCLALPGGHDWPTWLALWRHWLAGPARALADDAHAAPATIAAP